MSHLKTKERLILLNKIQEEAVDAVEKNGFIGTIHLPTGLGKSIVLMKCIMRGFTKIIDKGDEIWILAEEVKARKKTFFEDEIPKFQEIFGHDILDLFNVKFYSYNIAPKYYKEFLEGKRTAPKMILCDEVEASLSKEFHKYLNFLQHGVKIIGFTATLMATKNLYETEEETFQSEFFTKSKKITKSVNKGQMFQMFLPVVYSKSIRWAIDSGLLSPIETTIIYHKLSSKIKVKITKGKEGKPSWIDTEKKFWDFWNKLARSKNISEGFRTMIFKQKLPKFLFTQPSKVFIGKKLIELLQGRKILVFSPRIDNLIAMGIPVAEDIYEQIPLKTDPSRTKKIKVKTVSDWLNEFGLADSYILGSCKRLQRGVTLDGIDSLIIFLSGKSNTTLEQILGRLRRPVYRKIGKVFIIVTEDTYEEKWFEEAQIIRDYKGKEIGRLDLNIVKKIPSYSLWNK